MVAVAALVDSGADITVVPEGLVQVLGLPPVSEVMICGVAGTARVPVYAAELEAVGTRRIVEVVVGVDMLLGRDVLNRWVVTLDGPAKVLRVVPEGMKLLRCSRGGSGIERGSVADGGRAGAAGYFGSGGPARPLGLEGPEG